LRSFILAFAAGVLLFPLAVSAQAHDVQPPQPGLFQLWQALEEAIAGNPRLAAAKRLYTAAHTRPLAAAALPPPEMEALSTPWMSEDGGASRSIGFSLSQRIPGPGKRPLRTTLAERSLDTVSAELAVESRALTATVKHAYMDVYMARMRSAIYTELVTLSRQTIEAAEARYVGGGAPQQDVVRATVELTRMHHEQFMTASEARIAEARLNAVLSRPPNRSIERVSDMPEWRLLGSPEMLFELAQKNQPRLWAARAAVAEADAAVAVSRSEQRPDYVVRGGYQLTPDHRAGWTAAVGLTWPNAPWARTGVTAMISEAGARASAARVELLSVENAIRSEIYMAFVRARTAEEQMQLIRSTLLPQAQHAFEIARAAYQSTSGVLPDLMEPQQVLLESRLRYLDALVAFHRALVELEVAVGQELPRAILQPLTPAPQSLAVLTTPAR
jgi:cobalt-zinc-cadmium efflux system outer membrane protein